MENYIITNKTIAIIKKNKKTIIIDKDKTRIINKNIRFILNQNCMFHGSSLESRVKYGKSIVDSKYKIPIFINKNIILIQLNSLRSSNCLLLNLNKILNYNDTNDGLIINCVSNFNTKSNISKYSFEKLLLKGIKINNKIRH